MSMQRRFVRILLPLCLSEFAMAQTDADHHAKDQADDDIIERKAKHRANDDAIGQPAVGIAGLCRRGRTQLMYGHSIRIGITVALDKSLLGRHGRGR
jgi:hypothetical protein